MPTRPRVLSGIQPTADSFQLGNYLGAIRQWVILQEQADAFYCVVDLHALTAEFDPDLLRQRTRVAAAQLLAAGLDPAKCTLFVQSHVPQHTQLSWILECLTGFGEASRMTQFKDKANRSGERVGVGLFTYPVLMAADVLLYQADAVPVGEDQRQHLELTRDLAERFNIRFGPTFTVPEPAILAEGAKILDLQDPTAKMSKSLPEAGRIDMLDEPASIARKIRRAVTDADGAIRYDPLNKPGVSNLMTILAVASDSSVTQVEDQFSGQGYGALKNAAAEAVLAVVEPFRARTAALLDDPAELDRQLAIGAEHAREVAEQTVRSAYQRIGLLAGAAS
ncbi:MAG: tryptophan--tRNA ligase [Frankiaceae bacterium]|jgi:tryptophanyl-tRNA synthetase|nr:tryptophan--tRNA ligase [Frankiaceae bacterium]